GGTGDVLVRVVTTDDLGPTGLRVNGESVRTEPPRRLVSVLGLVWWELKAAGVSVKAGEAIPDAVAVAAVNADGAGRPVTAAARLQPPQPRPVERPVIVLELARRGGAAQPVHTNRPGFAFGLRVTSGSRLHWVEVRHGPPSQPLQVRAVKVAA